MLSKRNARRQLQECCAGIECIRRSWYRSRTKQNQSKKLTLTALYVGAGITNKFSNLSDSMTINSSKIWLMPVTV